MSTNDLLKDIKQDDYSNKFRGVSDWLNKKERQAELPKENWFSHQIALLRNFKTRQLAYICGALLLLASCSMPVEQTDTLGYVLSWSAEYEIVGSSIQFDDFSWLNGENMNINQQLDGQKVIATYQMEFPGQNEHLMQSRKDKLEAMANVSLVTMLPIELTTERPLYKAAYNKLFHVEIDLTNLDESEWEAAVQEQLTQHGLKLHEFTVNQTGDGQREVTISLENETTADPNATGREQTIEITFGADSTSQSDVNNDDN